MRERERNYALYERRIRMSGNYNYLERTPAYVQTLVIENNHVIAQTPWGIAGYFDSLSDVAHSTIQKTPGWRKLKVKPIKSFTTERSVINNPPHSTGRTYKISVPDGYGGTFSRLEIWQANTDCLSYGVDLRRTTVSKPVDDPVAFAERMLLKELSTAKSSSAVTLAELPKTVKAIAKTATKIAGALRALRKFDIDGLAKALEIKVTTKQRVRMGRKKREFLLNPSDSDILTVSNKARYRDRYKSVYSDRYRTKDFFGDLWLEYSYGWKPLLSDVYSHAEALANYLVQHQYVVQRGFKSHRTEGEGSFREVLSSDKEYILRSKVTKIGRVGVFYSTENVNAANVFGLLNPLQVAWELVPFSFVVDWFIPIGQAVESLTATDGLKFHRGYSSLQVKVTNEAFLISRPAYGYPGVYSPWGSGRCSRKDSGFYRSVLTGFPVPTFPGFKDWRSLSHGASAIALLNSLFLSKK